MIVIAGRTQSALDETVSSLPGKALGIAADVSIEADVANLFEKAVECFGRIDMVFNNAGIAAPAVPIDEMPVEAWTNLMNVNVHGAFLVARAAFGQMRKQSPQGGRIINNGSISSVTPRPFSVAYTTSKHAISGLTKCLALDGREFDIACGQIDLGNISSDMGDKMAEGVLQPNGTIMGEPTMEVSHVAEAVSYMANLPLHANVLHLNVMATKMPFVGRG